MSQRDKEQFLSLYRTYRYEDQLKFYKDRQAEFNVANTEAVTISIGLIFLAAIAAGLASAITIPWLKLTCLLVAAIGPILSTVLAGYSALYGFEQQAKLYHDTIINLMKMRPPEPDLKEGLSEADLAQYVHEIEETLLVEQGQWGQLARTMKPYE